MLIHLIHLKNVPIFEQLILEEALLREECKNFCILNEGSSPAIVMGISGKPEELIYTPKALEIGCPVIKRFSGGGTVFIDHNTLFLSFICNKEELAFPAYPERILKWSETILLEALELPGFCLKENDFVIENRKCGGNAQYITKDRFLQHTSFLWDYCPDNMKSLLHPKKTPAYREQREHGSFLCTLKEHFPTKETLFNKVKDHLNKNHIVNVDFEINREISERARISTHYIDLP